jgi:hypothetical protein
LHYLAAVVSRSGLFLFPRLHGFFGASSASTAGLTVHAPADRGFAAARAMFERVKARFAYRGGRFDKYSTARDRAGQVLACHVVGIGTDFARCLSAST